MESHRADTVGITEYVNSDDEVVVRVSMYRDGGRGARWVASFNKDALGERSTYHQARKLAATIAEGHRLVVKDETVPVPDTYAYDNEPF